MATIWSEIRGREYPGAFNREFMVSQVFRALAVLVMFLGMVGIVAFVLSATEEMRFIELLFESFSAVGIVGLSTGITPDLSVSGKLVVIITMFIGRLGPLTLTLALIRARRTSVYREPKDIVRIG
jgi:trk system potassium uptake protein TrkH